MSAAIDPRQQPDWEHIQQIAQDILDFPLNKPVDEPYDRNKTYPHHDQHKFGAVLRDTAKLSPVDEEAEADIGFNAEGYDRLHKVLTALAGKEKPSAGRAAQIKNLAARIIPKAQELVELLAQESDALAEEANIDTKPPHPGTPREDRWKKEARMGSLTYNQFAKVRLAEAKAQHAENALESANLRQGVMALFEELAKALGISLDKSHGGRT